MVGDSMLGGRLLDLLTVLGVLLQCLNKDGTRPAFVTSVCCSKSHGKENEEMKHSD